MGLLIIDDGPVSVPLADRSIRSPWVLGIHGLDASRRTVLLSLEQEARTYWSTGDVSGSARLPAPSPIGAIASTGISDISGGEEYQLLLLDAVGDVRWALRVAYEPPPPRESVKRRIVEEWREHQPEIRDHHFVWPDRLAAIENIEVDAHGNVYVFPHADRLPSEFREAEGPVPVDVYSPRGERIFAGWSSVESWDAAHGDWIYRTEADPKSGERVVARYRIDPGDFSF